MSTVEQDKTQDERDIEEILSPEFRIANVELRNDPDVAVIIERRVKELNNENKVNFESAVALLADDVRARTFTEKLVCELKKSEK